MSDRNLFGDEWYTKEHRDVFQELARDRPTPLEIQLQTARVYAEVAAREFSMGYPDDAKEAQAKAISSYQAVLDLMPFYPDILLRDKLKSIRRSLARNATRFAL